MEFELTEDAVGESNFVDQPGTYHFQIMDVKESQGPKGNLIDGFTFTLSVLAGTVKSEVGKTFNLTMFKPKLTEKDGGKFSRLKQTALLVACNLVDPTALGKRVSIELRTAIGHQFVARLERDEQNTKYVRVSGADTWHVDDPRAANVPKDDAALKLIPAGVRHPAEWFGALKKSAGNSGAKPHPQPQSKTDFSNL